MPWREENTLGGRMTVRDVLFDAEQRLTAVGVPSPSVDSAELVALALGTTRRRLFLSDPVTPEQKVAVEQLLLRRLSRVPLQHIMGTAPFRHLEVEVGPGVFIPRPETELVTEAAVRELAAQSAADRVAVDLCTGSGAIALSLAIEVPGSRVHAVELSSEALEWTQANLSRHAAALVAAGSQVVVVEHDAATVADPDGPLAALAGSVAVVVSNPPYIPDGMVPREPEVREHEPRLALYSGRDGLDAVRQVLRTAAILLRSGGLVVVEHADVQGADAGARGVPDVARSLVADDVVAATTGLRAGAALFTDVVDRIDLNSLPRFTLARRAPA